MSFKLFCLHFGQKKESSVIYLKTDTPFGSVENNHSNRSYHIAYKKSKNPDAYFRRYESQLILYGGARRVLEQAGINLKGLNVDKLKTEYQELMKEKNELTSIYKKCEKEVQSLNRKLENLNQYLGQTQPDFTSEQARKKNDHIL